MFLPSFAQRATRAMRIARTITSLVHDGIFPPRKSDLFVRKISYRMLREHLHSISQKKIHNYLITSPFLYHDEYVQTLILEAKFHKNIRAHTLLGKSLAEVLYTVLADLKNVHSHTRIVLIPIPLGEKRRNHRGYNQVEEIGRQALPYLRKFLEKLEENATPSMKGHTLGFSFSLSFAPELLVRTRETSPQMELGRQERLKNVVGAFAVRGEYASCIQNNPSHIYIVIDDVLTTGATLSAACEALTKAGAQDVSAIALAH